MSNPLDKMAENARELGLDYEPAQQEPVAWVCYGAPGKRDIDFEEADINRLPIGTQLYTSPPAQRTWVGLTDDEKRQLFEREDYQGWLDYINAIEAELKERNT